MLFDEDDPKTGKRSGLKWIRAFDGRLYNVASFGSFYVETRSEAIHDKETGRAVKKRVSRVYGHYKGQEEVTLSHPFAAEDIAQKVLAEVFEFIDRDDKSTFDLMPFEIAVIALAKLNKLLEES
jgi:hypothetical protein